MKKEKKERSNLVKEFKTFIARGNFIDMAVGIVVGGAFTNIVNTMVNSVITPLINAIIYVLSGGDPSQYSGLNITLIPEGTDASGNVRKAVVLGLSDLISSIINFFLIALVLFFILKIINKIRRDAEQSANRLKEQAKKIKNQVVNKEESTEE